ncbi:DUF3472 domain-containing protein [Chitinophaga lutea]
MNKLRYSLLPGLFAVAQTLCAQQSPVVLPGFTAYAVPAEQGVRISQRQGVTQWKDSANAVHFYFHTSATGAIKLALQAKSDAPSRLRVSLNGREKIVSIPAKDSFATIPLLETKLKDTGFYTLVLKGLDKQGEVYADIKGLQLEGPATKNIQFNPKPWRRSASVHLGYTPPEGAQVEWFYGEIRVPEGQDKIGTYFMSCGWHRGYFGMQVNGPAERRIIFSVWDAGKEPDDRKLVRYEDQVTMLAKGDSVVAHGFGGEGTGGHSHWVYDWKAGETYRFLMHAVPKGTTTQYTAYFFVPEHNEWKLIASFRAPKDGKYMGRLYSFLENFSFENGWLHRKGYFGNHWVKTPEGQWIELTKARFTNDATARAKDRLDFGGGAENGWFYLWTAGFIPADAKLGDTFERPATGRQPQIELPAF